IATLLVPATSFAATSVKAAKSPSAHFFPSRKSFLDSAHISAAGTNANATGPVLPYQGGPVMAGTAHVYAIFWEPGGNVSANYNSLINRYFSDVGGSPLYQNLKQYPESDGLFPSNAVLTASWVDTGAYPSNPLLDSDIQNEVTHAQSVNSWSSSSSNIFFVFTGKNEGLCTVSSTDKNAVCTPDVITPNLGLCAYHSYFGNNTIYAAIPYATSPTFKGLCTPGAPNAPAAGSSPNHDDADLTINLTSHEQMEAATDPFINAWVTSQQLEVGDLCVWKFGPNNAQGADVVWNHNNYIVQQEWDNAVNSCTLSGDHATRYYTIKNFNSSLVLDVLNAATTQGASAIQWSNHYGLSQEWDLVPNGSLYQIVNRKSRMVLDVLGASTTQGASVVQWGNHYGLSQGWYLVPDGTGDQIVNANSGMVLDVFHAKLTNGTQAVQWGSHNGTSQLWNFTPVSPYYKIQNANSGMVLDLYQGGTASGTNAIQWPYQNNNSQQWAVIPDGTRNGTPIYQIENVNSGMVLDVFHAQRSNGIQVVQWSNHNGTSQQWFIIADGTHNGTPIYLIQNVNSGMDLDVFHARTTAGTPVVQWSNHNGISQQWSIIATSE
ncbi:MAG: RICIN domain-containing protein, partial [Ktedonobacteraceae bacterium]|nr:RICIN domain-containing protein [Ktedonobacteraceae bacterium]